MLGPERYLELSDKDTDETIIQCVGFVYFGSCLYIDLTP